MKPEPAETSSLCPVCLQGVSTAEEAFLDGCYHRLCLKVQLAWCCYCL